MNDEIKEILDKLKDDDWYDELDLTGDKWIELKQTETKIILDYITNLQQAVEVKNERIKEEQQEKERYIKFYNELNIWNKDLQQENQRFEENNQNMQEEMARVWEENERLKETNVYCNRTDCVGRIKDSRKYDSVYQEKEDYKYRCEKAIEYIKKEKENYLTKGCSIADTNNANLIVSAAVNTCDCSLNILQNGSDSQ